MQGSTRVNMSKYTIQEYKEWKRVYESVKVKSERKSENIIGNFENVV